MPRNTLSSLDDLDDADLADDLRRRAPSAGDSTDLEALAGSLPVPDRLRALLGERRELEQRMAMLTGHGPAVPAGADPRFPVTPLGERRRHDAEWARRREASPTPRDEPDDPPLPETPIRRLPAADREPPQRTGQRALREAGRPLRELTRPLSAVLGRTSDDIGGLRDRLGSPDQTTPPLGDLSLDRLANDPDLRDFGRSIPEPEMRPLRSIDDTLRRARKRLDILEGGSGDLDAMRETALHRLRARREEAAGDRRRDDLRRERKERTDEDRDMQRLDRPRTGGDDG